MKVLAIIALLVILVVTGIGASNSPDNRHGDIIVQPEKTGLIAVVSSGDTGV
jgi:hypothetical protein